MGRKHYQKKDFIFKITSSHKVIDLCIQNFVNDGSGQVLFSPSEKMKKKKRLGPLVFSFKKFGLGFGFVIWVGLQICWVGFLLICIVDLGRFELWLGLCWIWGVKLLGSFSIQWVCTWAQMFSSFVLGLLGLMSSFQVDGFVLGCEL